MRVSHLLGSTVLLGSLAIGGCKFEDKSESSEPSEVESMVATLGENGLHLENYNEVKWGYRVSANVLKIGGLPVAYGESGPTPGGVAYPSSAPTGPSDSAVAAPTAPAEPDEGVNQDSPSALVQGEESESSGQPTTDVAVDESPIASDDLVVVDSESVYEVPTERYGYLAVRKCLRLQTQLGDGLQADGVYCLQVEAPEHLTCRLPTDLIRGDEVLTSVNRVTDENLELSSVLTAKLGFTYDSATRTWSKESDGIILTLSPLRVVALSFEAPCSENASDGSGDGWGGDGGSDGASDGSDGSPSVRIDMSARTGVGRQIAVDADNRLLVVASSAGTASTFSMMVGRFMPDNSLDQSFGTGGYAELTSLAGNSEGFGIKIDADRKRILVSGYQQTSDGGWQGIVVALQNDGTLDSTWGDSGVSIVEGAYMVSRFDVDADGRVYLFGATYGGAGVVMRLGADGKVDQGFGTSGSLTVPGLSSYMGIDLAVRGEALYLLVSNPGWDATYLMVTDAAGSDPRSSKIGTSGDSQRLYPESLIFGDDKIMVVGRNIEGTQDGHFVGMFEMDGSQTTTFAEDGVLFTTEGSVASGGAFEASGTFLISGWFGVRRYDMTGGLVKNFSDGYYLSADAIKITADGSLVGASIAHGGGEIFRLEPGY